MPAHSCQLRFVALPALLALLFLFGFACVVCWFCMPFFKRFWLQRASWEGLLAPKLIKFGSRKATWRSRGSKMAPGVAKESAEGSPEAPREAKRAPKASKQRPNGFHKPQENMVQKTQRKMRDPDWGTLAFYNIKREERGRRGFRAHRGLGPLFPGKSF